MRRVVFALSALILMTAGSSAAGTQTSRVTSAADVQPNDYIVGSWELYRSRFMTPEGRVLDDDNGSISHSEGQGYGMLIAIGADDEKSFDALWHWTDEELFIRPDGLAAWKWDPKTSPNVSDMNNATDGDLLIAWALLRASEKWNRPELRKRARTITDAIATKAVVDSPFGKVLLPGVEGFTADAQGDGPVVNLSYWVFPALAELRTISPLLAKAKLETSGLRLAKAARFGEAKLPSDWISVKDQEPRPAKAFAATFGYNAIRIPLYLAWYTHDRPELLDPYWRNWTEGTGIQPKVIDVSADVPLNALADNGYQAIANVVACSLHGSESVPDARLFQPTTYYPSTLHLLSLMALAERYPECL